MTFRIEEGAPDPAEARALLAAIESADGVEPFGEAFVRGLSDPAAGHRHLRVLDDGTLIGLAGVADDSAELAVSADFRRRGAGRALLDAVDGLVGKRLPVWAHGDVAGAGELAAATGRRVVRELLQMTAAGEAVAALGDEDAPEGIRLEDLPTARARMGEGAVDEAWLAVNNGAFDWHPEQGGWDLAQLRRGRDVEWFDPAGVLFAVDEGSGEILGFHWTKWHGGGVGEVYVIGLAGAARGRGVGGWLTRAGMRHLRDRGADRVILYVEGDNVPAVRTYERTGFDVTRRDVMYGM
ncbi:mycothiol synthase [Corynebacterium hansenii]|uniref:Mycothiol acetyltransferase n=1 Tax=Corynebacterium hansenii TaxID=394964 RepID=A0ABV7ZSH7_9CORY|nr:mycothiol synthase [Corynebacterium hansenii]WJZ00926.1 Mycothiol acetyltransferase [Corynebacterium hansenii]